MTRTEIISAVKLRYKQNTTELDTLIGSWVDESYRGITKQFSWKQLIVPDNSISLVAGTETYELEDDFWKIVPNSVRYYPSTSATEPGCIMDEIKADQVGIYKAISNASTPRVWALTSGSGNIPSITFLPSFSSQNAVVKYDYYSEPQEYDASDPSVEELSDFLVYDVLAKLAEYFNDDKSAQYSDRARRYKNYAFQRIVNG